MARSIRVVLVLGMICIACAKDSGATESTLPVAGDSPRVTVGSTDPELVKTFLVLLKSGLAQAMDMGDEERANDIRTAIARIERQPRQKSDLGLDDEEDGAVTAAEFYWQGSPTYTKAQMVTLVRDSMVRRIRQQATVDIGGHVYPLENVCSQSTFIWGCGQSPVDFAGACANHPGYAATGASVHTSWASQDGSGVSNGSGTKPFPANSKCPRDDEDYFPAPPDPEEWGDPENPPPPPPPGDECYFCTWWEWYENGVLTISYPECEPIDPMWCE